MELRSTNIIAYAHYQLQYQEGVKVNFFTHKFLWGTH